MVEICALASGSNGNCYYIGNENEAILIDAGINCKQILLRMNAVGLDPLKVKAVFISHEHVDHICGTKVFCNKHTIPGFFTPGTYYNASHDHRPKLYSFLQTGQSFTFGVFTIHTFSKNHDSAEPCSFRVEIEDVSISVMTDIGIPCKNVTDHLKESDILFLETNYDEKMLWEGNYTWPLKKRIASDHGHLSNIQAFDLVNDYANGRLKTIFLSHLSGENNKPEIAVDTFSPLNEKYKIICTSRHQPSELIRI
jgi:phosphoribosyl 1,2-cyclic phosphodiesterase